MSLIFHTQKVCQHHLSSSPGDTTCRHILPSQSISTHTQVSALNYPAHTRVTAESDPNVISLPHF